MKRIAVALAAFAFAALALGQLSKYKDWPKSPEAYFLTSGEKQEWAKVRTDDEAEKFIAAYWARRDPTPATAQNEFRDAIERRIAAADEQFKTHRQKGSETARGRLFIVLGGPSRVSQTRGGEQGGPFTGDAGLNVRPESDASSLVAVRQTWIYDKSKFDPSWGIGDLRIGINVDAQRGVDELTTASAANAAIAKVAEKSIVNPGGQVAAAAPPAVAPAVPPAGTGPAPAAPAAAAAPAPAPPGGAPGAMTAAIPAAVRSALEPLAKSATPHKDEPKSSFFGGPFHGPAGDPFYAVQLYIPAEKATGAMKFGGVVTDPSGQEVASYWEDAALTDVKSGTGTDKVYDKSIVVPPGSYHAALGLFPAAGGNAIVSAATAFQLQPKATAFEVSPLIVGNTLTPLTKRPGPTDPFVFGVEKPIRVEPKADRLFTKQDGLWYFYTVTNATLPAGAAPPAPAATPAPGAPPAAAPAEPKPRIMTRLGVLRDGQPAFAPFSGPADLQPLAANYYGTGSEIPLATFEPGWYTITLNVRDLNAPKESAAYKGVDRRGDFVVLKPDGSIPEKTTPKPATKGKPPAKK